ncbi:MAG: nitrilase-related carbon-nitrogen hydrolase [Isosphaeraceae bacterium]|nr:nitrilase-related carbon-nitrogen hydrolase [Isosphaeraceae bacterium]
MPLPERPHTGSGRKEPIKVSIAQIEPTLGNLAVNLRMHLDQVAAARADEVDLLVFPELSLTGYYLRDQVPEVAESREGMNCRAILEAAGPDLSVVFGFVEESASSRFFNSAIYSEGGRIVHVHRKVYLPTYGMFDEARYFAPGARIQAFDTKLGRIGVLICEDAWHLSSGVILQADQIDLLIIPSNSPARGMRDASPGSRQSWNLLMRTFAVFLNVPVIFANRVGYEDGVCFWGGSAVVGATGDYLAEAPALEPCRLQAEIDPLDTRRQRIITPLHRDERVSLTIEELERIRDERYRSES